MDKVDITVIGAGIMGLAVAGEAVSVSSSVFLLEKNLSFGMEASSRNSEVIHASIYYPAGSLKHTLCSEGRDMIYSLCRSNDIDFDQCGKFIVAPKKSDTEELHSLYVNAFRNSVPGIELVTPAKVKAVEPLINCAEAIFSPRSGIVDSHSLMQYFLSRAREGGAEIIYGSCVTGIQPEPPRGYRIEVKSAEGDIFEYISAKVINCAGLNSDSVAAMAGIDTEEAGYSLQYSKGSYFRLSDPEKYRIQHLIYPVVKKHSATLGIHLTPDLAGGIRLGPDTQKINGRETDYSVNESKKEEFAASVKDFFPDVSPNELYPDTAGIRASLKSEGEFKDFIIKEESEKGLKGFINLIGIDSPGLTASPAAARIVADLLK